MNIHTREELEYYLEADRIALSRPRNFKLQRIFLPDYILRYQIYLRTTEYYYNNRMKIICKLKYYYYGYRLQRLGMKLGFSIPINRIGPGLSIRHVGPIIINGGVTIGANCNIHVGVNIGTKAGYSNLAPKLGDNIYIGPGAKIFGDIEIASNIAIGANSVVNKSFVTPNKAIAGIPAKEIGETDMRKILVLATKILDSKIPYNAILGLPALETYEKLKKFGY